MGDLLARANRENWPYKQGALSYLDRALAGRQTQGTAEVLDIFRRWEAWLKKATPRLN